MVDLDTGELEVWQLPSYSTGNHPFVVFFGCPVNI